MVAARDGSILFEPYAPDFGPHQPHSVQSITKTTMNLVVGLLVERGKVELDREVGHYLPDIGSGYAAATVQEVLDMNVANDYSEDYSDPFASVFLQEAAMGWRLPGADGREIANREFVRGIQSADVTNRTGLVQYKSANTDVIGEIAERVSGRPLRDDADRDRRGGGPRGHLPHRDGPRGHAHRQRRRVRDRPRPRPLRAPLRPGRPRRGRAAGGKPRLHRDDADADGRALRRRRATGSGTATTR